MTTWRDCSSRNAECVWQPRAEQMSRFVLPIGAEVGPQQGELDQVVLRAAAANPFVFPGERRKRLDRAGKVPAFEGRESARHCRKIRARRVTPLARQCLYLTSPRIERGLVAHDGLRQEDMQIGEPIAGPRQGAVRVVMQGATGRGVPRMTGEL